jgi:hypothetical protein
MDNMLIMLFICCCCCCYLSSSCGIYYYMNNIIKPKNVSSPNNIIKAKNVTPYTISPKEKICRDILDKYPNMMMSNQDSIPNDIIITYEINKCSDFFKYGS